MKIFGNSKNGRHLNKTASKANKPKKGAKKIVLRCSIVVVAVAAAASIFAVAYWHWGVTPPEHTPWYGREDRHSDHPDARPPRVREPRPDDEEQVRVADTWTFLVLGTDNGGGNTDVIMAVTAVFEDGNYSLNAVSIPRDTMVNIGGGIRKANAIFPSMLARYRGQPNARQQALNATIVSFADVLGFEVDFAFVVDMNAFVALVNAVGSIEFDVPIRMYYPAENIDVQRGLQRLNGQQALGVVRYRATYAAGDIRRIQVQHDFLTAAVRQILENRADIRYRDIASIFVNYAETDLDLGRTIWFALEMLKLDAENVHFHLLPGNHNDSHRRVSYVTIFVDEWLEMVNTYLNPFSGDITIQDVSILTRDRTTRQLFVTDGNWVGTESWAQTTAASGSGSGTANNPPTTTTNGGGNQAGNNQASGNEGGDGQPDGNGGDDNEPGGNEEPPDEPPPSDGGDDPLEPQLPEIPPQIGPQPGTDNPPPEQDD